MDFSKIRNYLFMGLLLIITIAFAFIIKPFGYTIFWSAVLAALFFPVYKKTNKHLKHENFSSIITLLIVVLVILIPLFFIGTLLVRESVSIYDTVSDNRSQIITAIQNTNNFLKSNSFLSKFKINDALIAEKISEVSQMFFTYILNSAKDFTQNSIKFIALFIITFYTLFFFLRDGEKLLKKLMFLCPLGDRQEILLYKKFTSAVSATLKGTLLIGILQGILAGVLFAICGIKSALILGIFTALFSVIPAAGAFIVWMPTSLVMLFTGHIWQGILIAIVGMLIISTMDNFLRPIVVGKDLEMHPLLILFSTLGGLVVFGISGFIIGPIVAALLMSFWEMYENYYRSDLKKN